MTARSWAIHIVMIVILGGLGAAGLALGLWLQRIEHAEEGED